MNQDKEMMPYWKGEFRFLLSGLCPHGKTYLLGVGVCATEGKKNTAVVKLDGIFGKNIAKDRNHHPKIVWGECDTSNFSGASQFWKSRASVEFSDPGYLFNMFASYPPQITALSTNIAPVSAGKITLPNLSRCHCAL